MSEHKADGRRWVVPVSTEARRAFLFDPTVGAMNEFLNARDGFYSCVAALGERRPGVPVVVTVEYAQEATE